jgi:hypothetical protein
LVHQLQNIALQPEDPDSGALPLLMPTPAPFAMHFKTWWPVSCLGPKPSVAGGGISLLTRH